MLVLTLRFPALAARATTFSGVASTVMVASPGATASTVAVLPEEVTRRTLLLLELQTVEKLPGVSETCRPFASTPNTLIRVFAPSSISLGTGCNAKRTSAASRGIQTSSVQDEVTAARTVRASSPRRAAHDALIAPAFP